MKIDYVDDMTYNRVISLLKDNNHKLLYFTRMGSRAYGVATEKSDYDYYGVFLPSKAELDPFSHGYYGFGPKPTVKEHYDLKYSYGNDTVLAEVNVYNVVKYYSLAASASPNVLDSLFTDLEDVLYIHPLFAETLHNKKLFLSKKLAATYHGFAASQLKALTSDKTRADSKRGLLIKEYGYDVKAAYHMFRMLMSATDALNDGTFCAKPGESRRKFLIDVKNGVYTLDDVEMDFAHVLAKFKAAEMGTMLPETVDYKTLNDMLGKIVNK